MRTKLTLSALLALTISGSLITARAQDLPLTRRYSSIGAAILSRASQVAATPVESGSGTVLVVFRIGETGRVIDARATGGKPEMQESALYAIRQWHFPAMWAKGQGSQMISAANFIFAKQTVTVEPAQPMSAQELSPRLGFPCPNALAHEDAAAVDLCKKQLKGVQGFRASSDPERITAHDEYGLALLRNKQAKAAVQEFSEAIKLAPQSLTASDPEWSYLYWHRAAAEAQAGDTVAAKQDWATAKSSLEPIAATTTGMEHTYYQARLDQLTKQADD